MNRSKVALISICLNEPYWEFYGRMVESAKKHFLKGHDVDFLLWTDMPEVPQGVKVFPTAPMAWPGPTLFRYALFLEQEDILKEYDHVFYVDADMLFVSRVGDEILPENGTTAAAHPMYYARKEHIPPYEPNSESANFIPRPGRVLEENGKKRFAPFYAAGGFQGGTSEAFIKAMKSMKERIDEDFTKKNYIPIWNDETAWNYECFVNPPEVYLTPSYIYPDSLINEYYLKIWGRNFVPKIITLTKKFSLTKDGGANLQTTLKTL